MIDSSDNRNARIRGEWWILAAAVLWGTTGTAQAFSPPSAQPAAVGALRLLFAGLALFLYVHYRGSLRSGSSWPIHWTLGAAGCVAAYQLLFFTSVRLTGVAIGTLIAIGSAPIFSGILAKGFQRENLSRRWVFSTALAVAGCGLLTISLNQDGKFQFQGIMLALGAGLAYAGYSIFAKRMLEERSPEAVIAVVFSLAALLLTPLLFLYDTRWFATFNGIIVVLHLGIIATAFAYLMFAKGLKQLPVSNAVTLTLAEPLTAAFLGIFILQEKITLTSLGGILLLISGLTLLMVKPSSDLNRDRGKMTPS